MNLASPSAVKELLAQYGFKPSRGLGQNFLIDGNTVQKLLFTANITAKDIVLEIGPGIGTITKEIAKLAHHVIAIEKDEKMGALLQETLREYKNVELIHEDALTFSLELKKPYKVVSNLPYYITAPAIRKFLEAKTQPETLTVLVQKEVAQRICAKPPDMNILAGSVQIYGTPKIISYVKRTCFWPQPNVDSAILHITPLPQPYSVDIPTFFTVLKAGFKQPRKQLINNMLTLELSREQIQQWLLKNNIQPSQRAEKLSLQDWINLANTL